MRCMKAMTGVVFALALVPLGTALAQTDDGDEYYGYFTQTEGAFDKVDENGDGVVSRSEWNAEAHRIFGLLDHDGDGLISEEEYGFLPKPATLP